MLHVDAVSPVDEIQFRRCLIRGPKCTCLKSSTHLGVQNVERLHHWQVPLPSSLANTVTLIPHSCTHYRSGSRAEGSWSKQSTMQAYERRGMRTGNGRMALQVRTREHRCDGLNTRRGTRDATMRRKSGSLQCPYSLAIGCMRCSRRRDM